MTLRDTAAVKSNTHSNYFEFLRRNRPIKTMYFMGRDGVQTNSASNPLRAVSRCVEHLRLNSYAATVAEVFNADTGTLHAVVRRDVMGNIRIVYQLELQKSEVL